VNEIMKLFLNRFLKRMIPLLILERLIGFKEDEERNFLQNKDD